MILLEDFKKLEIRIGEIKTAERIPETDKLLRLEVDFGEEKPRQIISGIALYFPEPNALVGKKCAFAANLEPRIIKGLESQGMILAVGGGEELFSLLEVGRGVQVGARVK
ncbi:MAG: Methionyl-tRNA synthetase [Candidatus Beckwithbacteria bacterium GW2011_GWC2_47_9]|uniref:Methionine--tRNA ligase n=1 Tax=Candidatus Beckwithbacteria bacterium GW2011_GWC2_47_9 TaxID=1618373 RepID=A0A0G1TZN7_9BACT|nr:MAG: Methionyl-tRNA synthetase [Parcubacteria group bacterium GW2011_GWA2_47_21]KKU87291.1 MAG: Methionyl-tRNA synthetase [Candidatus Beckwithbacteria bacterium GW2011_GWC2_47_9]